MNNSYLLLAARACQCGRNINCAVRLIGIIVHKNAGEIPFLTFFKQDEHALESIKQQTRAKLTYIANKLQKSEKGHRPR